MSKVLDYSVGRPSPASIVQAGYVGVMRYVAPLPIDEAKVITAAEYAALRSAGLAVGLNWEWYANRPLEGAAAGTADAQEALRQANELGYQSVIYFSVDFDAAETDQPSINAYFQACAQVIGLSRLGAYAGYWPLKRLFDASLITYGWQTVAWSGGNVEGRASLLQDSFGVLGGDADGNEVLKDNWLGGVPLVPTAWVLRTFGKEIPSTVGIAQLATNLGLSRADLLAHPENAKNLGSYDDQASSVQGLEVFIPGYDAVVVPPPPPPPPPAPSDADLMVAAIKKVFPNL